MRKIKNHFRKIILAVIVAVFSVGTVTSISMVSSTQEAAAAEAQYLWPVPSSTKINQYYHDPNHDPNHDGIDIGGASGCDIVASKSP